MPRRSLVARAGAFAILLAMVMLPGCATGSGCNAACSPDERIPAGLVRLAERKAEPFSRAVQKMHFRDGRLHNNREAAGFLVSLLQPGDVLAVSNRGTLTARLIPGYFTHTAAYIGTEAQLKHLGLWSHPVVAAHRAAIRDGAIIIEAVNDGVVLSTPQALLDTDRVLALRPGGPGGTPFLQRRQSIVALLSRIGTPFDFHFDASTPGELFCVELLQRSIPALHLPVEEIYGRPTIKPVALAEALFEKGSGLSFLAYLKGERSGFQGVSREDLRAELMEAREQAAERAGCAAPTRSGAAPSAAGPRRSTAD